MQRDSYANGLWPVVPMPAHGVVVVASKMNVALRGRVWVTSAR